MLDANATPLIAATLVLLSLLCIWWLAVEWVFKKPVESSNRFKHKIVEQAGSNTVERSQSSQEQSVESRPDQNGSGNTVKPDQPSKSRTDTRHIRPTDADSENSQKAGATQSVKKLSGNLSPGTSSSETTVSDPASGNSTAGGAKTGGSNKPASEHKTDHNKLKADQNDETTSKPRPTPQAKSTNRPVTGKDKAQQGPSATNASGPVKSSKNASPQPDTANRKIPTAPAPKYQTAAKTQSPSVRSEASIQIPATTRREDRKSTDQLHAMLNIDSAPQAKASAAKAPVPGSGLDLGSGSGANNSQPSTNKLSAGAAAKSDNAKQDSTKELKSKETAGTVASEQVRAGNRTPDTIYTPAQNIESLSVAATHREQPSPSPKLRSVPNVSVARLPTNVNTAKTNPANSNSSQRKPSPIERAMELQNNTSPNATAEVSQTSHSDLASAKKPVSTESQAVDQPTAPEHTGNGDTALRAQLASSERRIKSLQSTLNKLQQSQTQSATRPAQQLDSLADGPMHLPVDVQAASTHKRPTLMSKVRILDAPRS